MTAPAYAETPRAWLRSLNCDGAYGRALAVALLVPLALAAGGQPWRTALEYQRAGLAAGEAWRLLTAHLVHLGVRHLWLDLAGLALLWGLYARALRPVAWLAALAAAVAAIDAGLWWLAPAVDWYVGLSGVLHGAWAAGAIGAWRESRGLAAASLALLAAKLAAEQWQQGGVAGTGLPVVVDAHLYGALGGLAGLAILGLLRRRL